jgi:hypothetical protein
MWPTPLYVNQTEFFKAPTDHGVAMGQCSDSERSSAALHTASAAVGSGGLLDGQPNFLAKRHLQGMAVGIANGG